MAYVYRHIRLDKNEPFYIGIGSDNGGKYSRSYKVDNRNQHWRNIVNKCGYFVEIVIDNISWEEAKVKEIEFIALYGRKQKGGILVNLTDGGEGAYGLIVSEETRQKQSLRRMGKPSPIKGTKRPQHVIDAVRNACLGNTWSRGKKRSLECRMKMSLDRKGKPSNRKGATHTEDTKKKMSESRKGQVPPNKGKKMSAEQREKLDSVYKSKEKPVLQFDMDWNFIKEYRSLSEVVKAGFKKGSISNCVSGRAKSNMGFRWKYKEAHLAPQSI